MPSKSVMPNNYDAAIKALTQNPGQSLSDLLAQLAPATPVTPATAPKAPLYDPLAATARASSLKRELRELTALFGKVVPDAPRVLTQDELNDLEAEKRALDAVLTTLNKRKADIHDAVHRHFDADIEQSVPHAQKKIQRDSKGRYLVAKPGAPERATTSGKAWSRERTGDTVTYSFTALKDALEAGDISRPEFLAATRPVPARREIDEDRISKMLVSDKQRERAVKILKIITSRTPGKLSLHLR